jgi:branched-chain amino acid transport system substrate-binding protein
LLDLWSFLKSLNPKTSYQIGSKRMLSCFIRISFFLCGLSINFLSAKTRKPCVIKIGVLIPISGPSAAYGRAAQKGFLLSFEELKKTSSCEIVILFQDTQGLPHTAALAANHLIGQNVHVFLGPMTSDPTNAVLPIAKKANIPVLSPSATEDDLAKHPYFSRVCYSDSLQAALSATFITKHLKIKEAVVLTNHDSSYSQGLSKAFQEAFHKQEGQIVKKDFYTSTDIDFKAMLGRLRRLEKQEQKQFAIFLPDQYIHAAPILRQAHELGLQSVFVGTDAWQSGSVFFQLATPQGAKNNFFTTHFAQEQIHLNPKADELDKQLVKRYRTRLNIFSALAYDSGLFLGQQIETSQENSQGLNDCLRNSKTFDGVTGMIQTNNGNPLKGGVIMSMTEDSYQFRTAIAQNDLPL